MSRKTVSTLMLVLLVLSIMAAAFKMQPARSSSATTTVPDDYPTIQAAINAASPGDTVYVKTGTYYENLQVHKALCLVGEDVQNTVIDGGNSQSVSVLIWIFADQVSETGFTLRNGGTNSIGICLNGTSYCRNS